MEALHQFLSQPSDIDEGFEPVSFAFLPFFFCCCFFDFPPYPPLFFFVHTKEISEELTAKVAEFKVLLVCPLSIARN